MLTAPLAIVVVVMLGTGETTRLVAADFVLSATEKACTVTVKLLETLAGALYVVVNAALLVNVPQEVPVHVVPETAQVTPLLPESLLTVAVKGTVWF